MSSLKNSIITLFFILLVFSPAPVFAVGFFANKDVIWEKNRNEYFKYADQGKSSLGINDHPVELEAKQLSTVLELIKTQIDDPSEEEKIKSLFTTQQANLLGRHLAEGLKKAKPNQDIIFAMEKSVKKKFGFRPDRLFVAGRAFYKNKKLNIIIGDYDRPRDLGYEAAVDPTNVGVVGYNFDHGNRAKNSRFKKAIINMDGVENKQLNNTLRSDWLVIDIAAASTAYDQLQTMRKQKEMAKKRKELKEILGGEEINNREETVPLKQETIPQKQTDHSNKITGTIEERLTVLKRLRDKDLITDEEYDLKRKQILDSL